MASILFLTFASLTQANGRVTSDAASARYRALIPGQQLARMGHKTIFKQILPTNDLDAIELQKLDADLVVFSKNAGDRPLHIARALHAKGKHIVYDQCDNYFEHAHYGTELREFTLEMCRLAKTHIASTERLGRIIHDNTGIDPVVISDPIEGRYGTPRFAPGKGPLRVLWFGHSQNWLSITNLMPALAELSTRLPLQLTLVTRATEEMLQHFTALNARFGATLPMTLRTWSLEETWSALAACDLVVIPSGESDFQAAKSPNRIAESIWAGRWVVAYPVPSYQPFTEFAAINTDLVAAIVDSVRKPGEVVARIARGQAWVRKHHSPWAIGRQWEAALGLTDPAQPLRVQLACGARLLPGYVNVDAIDNASNARPDIICPLDNVDVLASGSVDELLSLHPLRMLGDAENVRIAREMVRLMKPGGRINIECGMLELAQKHALFLQKGGLAPGNVQIQAIRAPNKQVAGARVTGTA